MNPILESDSFQRKSTTLSLPQHIDNPADDRSASFFAIFDIIPVDLPLLSSYDPQPPSDLLNCLTVKFNSFVNSLR